MAISSQNDQYKNHRMNLLQDITKELESEKYRILSTSNQSFFEEKTQLEYLKKTLQENNLRKFICFISDFNDYNIFRKRRYSELIVSDQEFHSMFNSKPVYINQHQLMEYSGLTLKQQSNARKLDKNSSNYLPHYKINSKTILYKLIDIEQWIEEKGLGSSDYILEM
jgi:hypothetical protein